MDTLGEVQHNAPCQMKLDYLWLCSRASGNPGFIWISVFWEFVIISWAWICWLGRCSVLVGRHSLAPQVSRGVQSVGSRSLGPQNGLTEKRYLLSPPPEEAPKDTQEAPKRPQEAPKRPKGGPQTAPQRLQNCFHETPTRLPTRFHQQTPKTSPRRPRKKHPQGQEQTAPKKRNRTKNSHTTHP